MFEAQINASDPVTLYRDLASALQGLVEGEPDGIANMANAAALIWESLPDINWVGFYRLIDGELVLGPFQGRPACVRIAVGRGVCGMAAATRTSQVVPDVQAFPGHIACDARSRSEIVVPIVVEGAVVGVLDLDSAQLRNFDIEDRRALETIVADIVPRIDWAAAIRV